MYQYTPPTLYADKLITPRARAGCCAVVEVEGAFFIGLVAATNYLAFSRFLELVHIDDMVRAQRERCRTARKTEANVGVDVRAPPCAYHSFLHYLSADWRIRPFGGGNALGMVK